MEDDEYKAHEVTIKESKLDDWIDKLNNLKNNGGHAHLQIDDDSEIMVHLKE